MRIYLVFYKKLLELVLLDVEVAISIKLKDNEYEVEEIRDLKKISS